MWAVVWLIAAKLHSHHPGHFRPYPLAEAFIAVDNYNKWGTAEAGAKIIKWLDAELA